MNDREKDSPINPVVADFNRTLNAIASGYQKQVYLAGLTQAKHVWDAMQARPLPAPTIPRQTRRVVMVACLATLVTAVGSLIYRFATHSPLPPSLAESTDSLSYWLNLVK